MFSPELFKGKRYLITGGGSGLGKSMAEGLADLGATVYICGRRQEMLEETAREFSASGRDVRAIPCDIRKPEEIEATLDAIWKDGPLDGLVNNAAGNFISKTEELSTRAVDAVLSIVLHGTAYMTLACGKRWIASGRPASVVSLVTTYAWTGSAFVVPSAMGKAGVLAMTQSLAVEWGPKGIRLNAIAPGPFPTKGAWERLLPNEAAERRWLSRIPLGRVGDHRELSNLVSFLLCDGSAYIQGDVVTIDGGEWLKGAGQFSFLGDQMTDADWQAMKTRGR